MPYRPVAWLLWLVVPAAAPQQSTSLNDGQQVTMHGTLAMRPAGRLHFVVVRTAQAYLPTVPGGTAAVTHEVGLSNYSSYDLLYAHRGQTVTVVGTVETSNASPYYLHSLSVSATSIRLANGTDLRGAARTPRARAANMGRYQAGVELPADLAAPWRYVANSRPDPQQHFLSCSSNGGGDVVNCSCANGFGAVGAASSTRGVTSEIFSDSHTAQFGVGEGARRIRLSVTCSR